MRALTEVFDKELASIWLDFRPRDGQLLLAQAVESVIEDQSIGLFEAGTGTGKTLAYLIPAFRSRGTVLISTGTKNLQDQLLLKDIPLLRQLFPERRIAILKGRANYLCLYRLNKHLKMSHGDASVEDQLTEVRRWSTRTHTGDLNEAMDLEKSGLIHSLVTSTRESCLGSRCPEFDNCALYRARERALEADIVIVNHHLLFADLSQRDDHVKKLLPSFDTIIVDEAHQVPETARQFFGQRLSGSQLRDLTRDLQSELTLLGSDDPMTASMVDLLDDGFQRLHHALLSSEASFFNEWFGSVQGELLHNIDTRLTELSERLSLIGARSDGLDQCARRVAQLQDHFALLTEPDDDDQDYVHWIERTARSYVIHRSPIHVADDMQPILFAAASSWVFTSATLTLDGTFTHFTDQLGIQEADTGVFTSPFPYEQAVKAYVPDLPEPGTDAHTVQLMATCEDLLRENSGRAFLLFTSHRALQTAAGCLAGIDRPLMVQGEQSKMLLLEKFKREVGSVLLGTQSFWEGVDVRGSGLRLLIIDKLPFPSPGEPLYERRAKQISDRGGNPFMDLAMPSMMLALKQGFGRLMREDTDRGLFVLGDARMLTRRYRGTVKANLPEMTWLTDHQAALDWLKDLGAD